MLSTHTIHPIQPIARRLRVPLAVVAQGRKNGRLLMMTKAPDPLKPPPPARALRRPTPQQGRALELLGHAIEYLLHEDRRYSRGESSGSDAVRLLMGLNRAIFAECEIVVPLGERLRSWMMSHTAA